MKIQHVPDLPDVGVSHNDEIKKKVILERGQIPKLMTFGQATFKPNQSVDTHKHNTMFEVFYIQKGKALFIVEGKEIIAKPGDAITIEPGEYHSQANPYSEDVTWLYFSIAID